VQDVFEFSRKDPEMFVYTMWRKKDKTGRVVFSARIYGIRNQLRVNVEPKKVTLTEVIPAVLSFKLNPTQLGIGTFRVDILVNDLPVSRTFFQITD
jgi:hypothetical protein